MVRNTWDGKGTDSTQLPDGQYKMTATAVDSANNPVTVTTQIQGVVKAFDETTKTVTLEDGSAYVLADGVTVEGLAAGKRVQVTFDDASKAATAVTIVQ